MEKASNVGFNQQQHPPSPNINSLGFSFDTANLNTCPVFMNSQRVEGSTLKSVSFFPGSALQQYRTSEPYDSQNLFKCIPQAFTPVLDPASEERFPSDPFIFGEQRSPTMLAAPARKRFLVFDQTGDRTTLVHNSGFQIPVQFGASFEPNPFAAHNLIKEEPGYVISPVRPISANENVDDDLRDAKEDEMHEDTEELNALLYSDSNSGYSVDDEETSTGHSPSTMTENVPDLVEETGEEVDSFAAPAKRQKLLGGGYDTLPNRRIASSFKTGATLNLEDAAESSCGSKPCKEELHPHCGGKRSRKEKICETLSILKSIFPNVYGDDPISVIDEAIHHLRSLKAKAVTLGPIYLTG